MKYLQRALCATVLALVSSTAYAQPSPGLINACDIIPTEGFTVTASRAPTVAWTVDALVPVSATDPTLVPNRINGFYIQLDGGTKYDVGLPKPGGPCPEGSPVAGQIPYSYRFTHPATIAQGKHSVTVWPWNFRLNADGSNSTVRQQGDPLVLPFVATDLVAQGKPPAVRRIVILR